MFFLPFLWTSVHLRRESVVFRLFLFFLCCGVVFDEHHYISALLTSRVVTGVFSLTYIGYVCQYTTCNLFVEGMIGD